MRGAGWPQAASSVELGLLGAVVVGSAWSMARTGPKTTLLVPAEWESAEWESAVGVDLAPAPAHVG
jgi:hypothetical protein